MTRLAAIALILFAIASISSCKDVPGADGRYATHDHGRNNHP
jgi:hypothetical protein